MRLRFIVAAMATSVTLVAAADAATLSRSVSVQASPAEVWRVVGPFCAIAQWHPAIGSCAEDRSDPATRTLVTKDGKATFVEVQTGRSERRRFYSYAFKSAPVPVTGYSSTIRVAGTPDGHAIVTWSGAYTPDAGKAAAADAALSGIYQSGLDAIKARFAD
jgi:uncharacterized protein YndB with AHSA1/START domain